MHSVAVKLMYVYSQFTASEIGGALGDLGTFLPLTLGLVQKSGLDLGTTLIATGLANVLSGLAFDIPIAVQPMSVACAVALSSHSVLLDELLLAGICVSFACLFLAVTRLITLVNGIVPASVVRGIQLAVGLSLADKGFRQVLFVDAGTWYQIRPWHGADGLLTGVVASAAVLLSTSSRVAGDDSGEAGGAAASAELLDNEGLTLHGAQDLSSPLLARDDEAGEEQPRGQNIALLGERRPGGASAQRASGWPWCGGGPAAPGGRQVPTALVLVLAGLVLAAVRDPSALLALKLGPSRPRLLMPTWEKTRSALLSMAIPQLPLTVLNSVIATSSLAQDLFGSTSAPVGREAANVASPAALSLSVAAMNLCGAWLGMVPCCHGAGGLAAQYKFGARSGAAPVALGCVKLALGLLLGSSLAALLDLFPASLLGAMLAFAGIELAGVAIRHQAGEGGDSGSALMLATAGVIAASGNCAVGVAAGWIGALLLRAKEHSMA